MNSAIETERIQDKLKLDQLYEHQSFNRDQMVSPKVHRSETKEKWLSKSGFNPIVTSHFNTVQK